MKDTVVSFKIIRYSSNSASFQAHCYARWVLTQVCLEAGHGFINIEDRMGDDGKPDLMFKLDQKKIDAVGKPAVTAFLAKLQVGIL